MKQANIKELNINQKEMYLLYAQSIELQYLYNLSIEKNSNNILKYYLLPKKWLDHLKVKYNYSSIKQEIKYEDCLDYNKFKQNISKRINNNNNINKELNLIENYIEKKYIPKYKMNYLENFIPVRQDIFENLNDDLLYEIIIGEGNIIIFDNNKQKPNKCIFICSINSNYENENEDISEFMVNIDSFLILDDKKKIKEKKKLIHYISGNKGINNYYKERNIDSSKIGEQIIYDKEEDEIGIFFNFNKKEDIYQTPNGFMEEYINKFIPKEKQIKKHESSQSQIKDPGKEQKNLTEMKLINAFGPNIDVYKLNQPKKPLPKCITIYGDIYYYLKQRNKNNCYIYRFNE